MAMIITATLITVADTDNRMMNREKLFCGLKAMRRAMKAAKFKRHGLCCKIKGMCVLPMVFTAKTKNSLHLMNESRKNMRSTISFLALFLFTAFSMTAQIPDAVYNDRIKTVLLHPAGNPLGYPVIRLNSADALQLYFDDLDASVRNYAYTYQLCNADWTPAMLSQFDFIKGFSQVRITTYRMSSVALTRYTHYQATLPDRNCFPTRSGNYILKVFRDGDTSKLIFTKRFLVVDEKSSAMVQIQQPYNGQIFRTHQKVQLKIALNEQLNVVNHLQQVKVVILQNNRWDNARTNIKPTFFSRNQMEFNPENDCIFPSGKEWRWLDLRSFRLQSDRVERASYLSNGTLIYVKPDVDRSTQRFNFFRDANGQYIIQCTENLNPYWQADYATVHFTFVPPGQTAFSGRDIYLFGQLTNYSLDESNKMEFNEETGTYEKSLFLKQGYYDYMYLTIDHANRNRETSFDVTEGNIWETENNYTILVYYRPLAGRADELIGYTLVNSLAGRKPGIN